ncbi:hypothetical protein KC330_g3134 [Hortaea werneckii]|nr:hypothetical protein KC330_g3134 [Hortaea werneckii]
MAAPRLPFLWPVLFRSSEASTPAGRSARAAFRRRTLYSTSQRRQHEQIPQRYGPANEPPPHLGGGKSLGPSTKSTKQEQTKLPRIGQELQRDGEEAQDGKEEEGEPKSSVQKLSDPTTVDGSFARPMKTDPPSNSTELAPEKESAGATEQVEDKNVEGVLDSVPDPAQYQEEQEEAKEASPTLDGRKPLEEDLPDMSEDEHMPPIRAPHIEPPRHVHHFDTYGLVNRLVDSGWDNSQAITIMKSVRLMMADNMDLAREALVSKSMVENETYLFRAACAELRTEVTTRRKAEQEKMRTERTHLQHEVDILGQRLGQESGAMKDELKGMFDDRKMAVRNEQREMESKVQQLNYKITVDLQADSRSEIEGLRWVMTRRVIIALGVVVVMVIGSLRLASTQVAKEQEEEKKRKAALKAKAKDSEERRNEFIGGGLPSEKGIDGGQILIKDGDNPSFVSLG